MLAPGRAVGVQAVIDRNRDQPPTTPPRPCRCKQQQRHGVATTGQGEDQRVIDMMLKPGIEAGLDAPCQRRRPQRIG